MQTTASCVGPPLPTGAIIFGSILVAGVVVSYSLQVRVGRNRRAWFNRSLMISIFVRKSSEGLSYLTLGLALFSSLLTCINFIILNWSRITCCFTGAISASTCLQNNLTTLQLVLGALCLFVIFIQLLVYFPLRTSESSQKEFLRARVTIYATIFFWVALSLVGITMHFWLELSDSTLAIYGKVIGIISAIVVVIQWSPQIYTTWQLESAGALSIPMLLLQMPGSLSTVFFQAFIDGADFSTWGPYLVSAIEQAILVIMCMAFWCKNWAHVQSYDDLLALEDEPDSYSVLPGSTASAQNSFDVQTGFGTVARGNSIFYHGSGSHSGPYKDGNT